MISVLLGLASCLDLRGRTFRWGFESYGEGLYHSVSVNKGYVLGVMGVFLYVSR